MCHTSIKGIRLALSLLLRLEDSCLSLYIYTTGLTADAITYNTLINACARAADAESSVAFQSALEVLQVLRVLALLALLVLKYKY
jgi:hypothetical protein